MWPGLPDEALCQIGKDGGQGQNRTADTRIFSPLLYLLSYLAAGKKARRKRAAEGAVLKPLGRPKSTREPEPMSDRLVLARLIRSAIIKFMKVVAPAILLLASALVMSPVFAQSGVAAIAAEATVYEDDPDDNGGIYGEVCIGNHETTATRRAFVRFTLPAIPAGAVITRVVYNFTQVRARGNCPTCPKTANIELRRVLASWQEGLGGANNAACGGGTNVPGVTWNGSPAVQAGLSATEFLPSAPSTPITIDTDIGNDDDGLIDDLQAWVDAPASNFGWELRVQEEGVDDNARLINPGSVTVHWTVPNGGVMLVKDGVFDPGANGTTDPGDLINYTFSVTNTGDVELTNVAITDPLIASISCPSGNPIPSLAPAAMEICTGSYAITQDDIDNGVVNNTAMASAMCTAPNCPVNDSDSHMQPIPPPPLDFVDGFESP